METSKLFFECEKCGQPFDFEINSGNFELVKTDKREAGQEYMYEFKNKFYCCCNNIEIKISIQGNSSGGFNRNDISCRGLRNFRTDENFNAVMNEACQKLSNFIPNFQAK